MQPAVFLTEIERALSSENVPLVLAAIKHDPLVWSALQQPGFVRSIFTGESSSISDWTPASLALKPLGDRVRLAELSCDHLPAIEGSLRKQAIELLESTIKTGAAPRNLTEAGLIALALRERRRKLQSWRGIFDALLSVKNKDGHQVIEVWRTPLACLFTMIPDGKELLAALLPQDHLHPAIEWISHILLANPLEEEERSALFYEMINRVSLENQVEWLAYLKRIGRFRLAGSLADRILAVKGNIFDFSKDNFCPEKADMVELSRKVLYHQIGATLHQFAGHPLQAELHLEKVRNLLQHWLVGSTVQMISVADYDGKSRIELAGECSRLLKQFSVSESLATEALFAFDSKSADFSLSDPEFTAPPLLVKMDQARQLAQSGSRRQAQEVAYVAVHNWMKQVENDPSLLSGQFIFELNPLGLLDQLVELGLYSDAIAVGEKFLSVRPEDRTLMTWLGDLCHRIGDDEKAVNLLYQVALLEPGKPETLRQMAAIFEDRKDWDDAVALRQRILAIAPKPAIEDQLDLARCAYGAHKYDAVRQTCENVLAVEPDQGLACTYLGMACLAEGDFEAGVAQLNKATLLIPENPLPWIQLAEAYKQKNEPQRALETLRAAVITAPDSAELHFAVGQTCLEAGLTSEALPFLRQAAKLAPESDRVGLALAETLLKLGHEADALAVIEKTRTIWPAHPGLASLHAKILLERKEIDRGLSILEIALQADDPDPAWFILYAKTLIGEYERYSSLDYEEPDINALIKANKMIQKAVNLSPESFEARLLLAEVLSLRGEYEAAYAAYMQIVELPEAGLPAWNWRVQAGLGRTALALNQTDAALASLQNAVSAYPESISLQRCLSQAYRQANLLDSAKTSARAALALAPDEIGNLVWFAGFMSSIGGEDEAVEAYQIARQMAPDRTDLAVLMAETLLGKGDLTEARKTLEEAAANERIGANELRRIAHAYMKMGDHHAAVASMERAASSRPDDGENILYELAEMYALAGDLDQSLDTIQKAIRENPGQVKYYLFLSEVQRRRNHPQAALASLEHVLRLIGANAETARKEQLGQDNSECGENGRQTQEYDLADIHLRFAGLLQKVENLGSALYHAEKALEEAPRSLVSRCLAVELAMKLLQYERAEKLAAVPEPAGGSTNVSSGGIEGESFWRGYLYSLRAELALERGDLAAAARDVAAGLAVSPGHPRLKAVEIRILATEGDYQAGDECLAELLPAVETGVPRMEQSDWKDSETIHKVDLVPVLAAAAVELRRWNEALDLYAKYTNGNPSEPRGLLLHAAALARAAQWKLTTSQLKVETHSAPESALAESAFGKFTQLISDAKKFCNSPEIERWRARGEVVFHPTSGSVRTLSSQQLDGEDISMLIQAMVRLGNLESARQLGEQYSNDSQVNLQLSLLELPNEAAYLLERAQAAVAGDPKNPVVHAAAARGYELHGDISGALDSLKIALFFWENEAQWHAWAGALAERCQQYEDACAHYEQALEINPGESNVALKLGQVYLKVGRSSEAVEIFSQAVNDHPKDAGLWLNLAEAKFAAGDHAGALSAAETAVGLDPTSSGAKVLCGEIALTLGSDAKALNMVREALTLDPRNVRARLLTSKILVKKGKDKEALAEISRAVEELPNAVDLQVEKAQLTHRLLGPAEALKVLSPVLQKHPDHGQLLSLQALVCSELGEIEQAEAAALHALRINSAQADIQRLLGNIYRKTGQLDKSLHHMSEAARLDPENIEIYLELGEIYTARREYSQALKSYQQAMNAAPEDHRPYYLSALVLRDGKDYPGAESMMRRAAQLAPKDVNIHRQLGAIVALNLVQSCQEADTCQ